MKFMTIANTEAKTIDSREVAVMIEMRHTDLLRKIDGYIEVISENAKLRSQDYFVSSTYKTDGNNKTYPCYKLTKMGCEMVANKLTGNKGILFTAEYVKRFNDMEKPKSQIDMIIESALALKAIEQEQEKIKQAQAEQEKRLLEVESKQSTIDKNYYTISGYAKLMRFKGLTRSIAIKLGKQATKLSREMEYLTGEEYDAKYGTVKTYHKDILKIVFKN